MTLPKPVLDNRTFAQLVSESVGQINRLSPQWTNYNASDPGITLIELFAWLSEQNMYRTGRTTPELSRAFLRLVGVTQRPAGVASTVVLLTTNSGAISLPDRVQITDTTGALTFETRDSLTVSPANLVQLLAGPATLLDVTAANSLPFDPSEDDRAGTFQPFGDAPRPGAALYLGFDQPLGAAGDKVALHVWTTTRDADAATLLALQREWIDEKNAAIRDCAATVMPLLEDWRRHYSARVVWEFFAGAAGWQPLPDVEDDTRALTLTGFIRFTIPHGHVAGGPGPLWFVRCRLLTGGFECPPRLDFIGINAVTAEHAVTIDKPETLGTSRGHAAELYVAAQSPIAARSTKLTLLSGANHDDSWTETLSWDLVGAHDRNYLLEPESGRIISGNGLRGAVFPAAWSVVLDYRVGGGEDGNFPAAQLSRLAQSGWNIARIPGFSGVAAAISVEQPYAATGGAAAETLAQAETRALTELAAPSTTVTLRDFETLALATPGVPVGSANALANHHPALPCFNAPGNITVTVVPNCPGPAPMPGEGFLRAVYRYLHRRRPITTELHVVAPHYVKVTVSATLNASGDADPVQLAALAQQRLDAFFNPLRGGPQATGWPIGRSVYRTEVMTMLAALPNVIMVSNLALAADGGEPCCQNLTICADDLVESTQHSITVSIVGTMIFKRSKERECP